MTRYDYLKFDEAAQFRAVTTPIREIKASFDVVLYLASIKTASNQTTVRLTWAQPMGSDCPKFISDIPTLFVSIDNPYHLQDVPRVRTFINGYTGTEEVVNAVVDKLVGRSEFKGTSPVDPFCGYWEAHL